MVDRIPMIRRHALPLAMHVSGVACHATAALLLLIAVFANAAPPDVDVTASVDRTEVTVGERLRYTITVTHPAEGRIELPAVRGNTGSFEVLAHDVRTQPRRGRRTVLTHTFTLAAFVPGDDSLPPQRVEYHAPGDTATIVLHTPPTAVRVVRVAGDADDLADITGVERLSRGVPWGLLLLLLASGLALRAWLRRKKTLPKQRPMVAPPSPPPPSVPPDLEALEALRVLEARGWEHDPRAFVFALSEIIRRYLGRRYGIDALEATTGELLERTRGLPLHDRDGGGIDGHAWLASSSTAMDAVKYAAVPLDGDDAARWIVEARAFVTATRPTPPAPALDASPATRGKERA